MLQHPRPPSTAAQTVREHSDDDRRRCATSRIDPPAGVVVAERSVGGDEQGEQLDREQHEDADERDEPLLANRRPLDAQRPVDEEDEQHGEGVLEVGERTPEEQGDEREAEQDEPGAHPPRCGRGVPTAAAMPAIVPPDGPTSRTSASCCAHGQGSIAASQRNSALAKIANSWPIAEVRERHA